MSIHFQVYGVLDPIYFKVTKNGVGLVAAPFSTGDIQLSIDGAAFTDVPLIEIAEVGLGVYEWTPTGTATTGKVLILNIKELTGTNFDENCLIIATGGNALARHSG